MSYAFDSSLKLAAIAAPTAIRYAFDARLSERQRAGSRTGRGALLAHSLTSRARPGSPNRRGRTPAIAALRRWDSPNIRVALRVPSSSAPNNGRKCPDGMSPANCVDYLYSPSMDEVGIANGMWGLFRSYDPTEVANKLQPLPNNPIGPAAKVTLCDLSCDLTSAHGETSLQRYRGDRAEGPGIEG